MSLVDYDSSSGEEKEDEEDDLGEEQGEQEAKEERDEPNLPPALPNLHNRLASSSLAKSNNASSSSLPSVEKLPDASMLLSSPSFSSYQLIGNDHSSRVVAAIAESGSRKRESNGSGFPHPRSKLPRSSLPHSRNVPDTLGGLLIPPQLTGRSNVVTEDVNKLFVNKRNHQPSQ
ncbi:hypothetical protein IHE45_12G045400 [Dioscorea alata]|uniref:Uncharacterized protein n=1 Tax=Dioscorea alata TaxID=55571 RepID=A0ACB7V1T2_DIOAL|nr:hypothetical protein IHE45_12G045400 [Dioscorea alata]